MNKLIDKSSSFLLSQQFDALSLGVIDFSKEKCEVFELNKLDKPFLAKRPSIEYDLASLSKPLTNGIGFLDQRKNISTDMELVLNHRGGLPAWGLLPRDGWEKIIMSYNIVDSPTLYSDYSALRFMLEFNNTIGADLYQTAGKYWDEELFFWKDLKNNHHCLQNGFRNQKPNIGFVHDPNAFTIGEKVSHAGLFGTINGVCKTLLELNKKLKLLPTMLEDINKCADNRFVNGWDRATDLEHTLAGKGCSKHTFGHLGFTGTSIWIDPIKNIGHVLLTNATKLYWYDKKDLNTFRREIGQLIWENDF